jgi:hypothetical protein
MEPNDARYAALRAMGGIDQHKEQCRDALGVRLVDDLRQDVGYAVRLLRRTPGFTGVAVATLALGIGASTAIFTVIDAVLLRPLSFAEPLRLTMIRPSSGSRLSPGYLYDWRLDSRAFHDLSYGFWQRRFGGDRGVVGQSITLDGEILTIIGVMPEGFTIRTTELSESRAELWMPFRLVPGDRIGMGGFLNVVARLAPGVTVDQAQATRSDPVSKTYDLLVGDFPLAIGRKSADTQVFVRSVR